VCELLLALFKLYEHSPQLSQLGLDCLRADDVASAREELPT